MSLDISTLYLLATLVAVLLGAMLLYFGRQEKIAALNWWGAAYLLAAATLAIWTLLGTSFGDFASCLIGASGILASGMIWNAARVFHGRAPVWAGIGIGVALWILVSLVPPFDMSSVRLTFGAIIVALFAGLASGELWSERRRTMQQRWPALAVPVLHGSVLLLPVLIGDLLADNTPLTQNHWATAFAVELVLYAIGTVFVIFMLVSERSVREHKAAALIDPLSGLFNRRGFAETAAKMMARRAQLAQPVSMLVLDLDHFKSVNDRFGHAAGDEVLRLFATTLEQTLRTTDLCGRLGGEEFAALLPCSVTEAAIAAERVREAFEASDIAIDDVTIVTTVSIGVAAGADLETMLHAADLALYRAKNDGRNRVEISADPDVFDAPRSDVARKPNVVRRGHGMREMAV